MGVDIALYRVRIGLFNRFKSVSKTVCVMSSVIAFTSTCLIIFMLLQMLLCLSGDVELNPGPHLSKVSLWHCNVRGLNTEKIQAITADVSKVYDLLAICKTFLTENSKCDLKLEGYLPMFRKDRTNGWGGVALYVSEHIVAQRKPEFELPNQEMLCVELTINHNKLITCVCYRPPNNLVQFWDQLQYLYDLIRQADYNQIILTGDFNSDPQTTNGFFCWL